MFTSSSTTTTLRFPAADDGEIGVFGAEKYFNGGKDLLDDDDNDQQHPTATDDSTLHNKHLILSHIPSSDDRFHPPPASVQSASSQKPLLLLNDNTVKKTTTHNYYSVQKRRFLPNALAYCVCYSSCHDKNAVDVGEISFSNAVTTTNNKFEEDEGKTAPFRQNHFSFPTGKCLNVVHNFQEQDVAERKSLEVFGSPVVTGRLKNKPTTTTTISLEKRLAMLSWDHTTNNNNNSLGGLFYNDHDDEVNSDCSSDLFEIESLTKQTHNNPLQSPAAASCYTPSEGSVEWSVVTASALDFDERRLSTSSPTRVVVPAHLNKQHVVVVQKRRSSSLLGCKSEKAVRVAEESNNNNNNNNKSNIYDNLLIQGEKSESARFEHETKLGGFIQAHLRAHATRSTLPRPRGFPI